LFLCPGAEARRLGSLTWGWAQLNDYKETLQDHEKRLRNLEANNIRLAERLENLCKELSSLTTWVKTLVVAMLTSLVGFFIWYIQSLPR